MYSHVMLKIFTNHKEKEYCLAVTWNETLTCVERLPGAMR